MGFCNNCGTQMTDGVRFCENCGTPTGANTGPAQPPPAINMEQVGQQAAAAAGAFAAGTARAAQHAADRLRVAAEAHTVVGGGAVAYDEHVIEGFAAIMYRRAFWTVVIWTAIGLVVGLMIGGGISSGLTMRARMQGDDSSSFFPTLLGFLVGGGLGYWIGLQKAFWLKLAAQVALCQVQIERNTRS